MTYFEDLDPESIDEMEVERNERNAELRAEAAQEDHPDPFEDYWMPGYVTDLDYMNAQEADDYTHEFDDIDF